MNTPNPSDKTANALELARMRLTTAESAVQTAKQESRRAKRRRNEAKEIARRAKKRLKRAKERLAEARRAVAEAEENRSLEVKIAAKAKRRAQPRATKAVASRRTGKKAKAIKPSDREPPTTEASPVPDLKFPDASVPEPGVVEPLF